MREEILRKFLNDTSTESEFKEVIRWLDNDFQSQQSAKWVYNDWNDFQLEEGAWENEKHDELLNRIHHKINIGKNNPLRANKLSLASEILIKAAAILFLPVLGLLIYNLSGTTDHYLQCVDCPIDSLEIVAPVGSQTVVHLSDGSEVFLNHGSKLRYPQYFTGATRNVVLLGEGYFKVAHNPAQPFVVSTEHLTIKALGTSFNVMAYPDEKIIETTLVEGKVTVSHMEQNEISVPIGAMVPGQHLRYNSASGKFTCTQEDIAKYVAWKEGKLIFKNESIVNITGRLSRWFNVEFEIHDADVREYTYTATFVDETLSQILDLLTIATPIRYRMLPREKLPDGTFSKQKIIIERKKINKRII